MVVLYLLPITQRLCGDNSIRELAIGDLLLHILLSKKELSSLPKLLRVSRPWDRAPRICLVVTKL
jgi:hypothetical protein